MIEDFLNYLVENFEDSEIGGDAMTVLMDIEEQRDMYDTMTEETDFED